MKSILRKYLIILFAIWITTWILPGAIIFSSSNLSTFLAAALILFVTELFIAPLIKLVLLPLNLITFGAFRWLIVVLVLFIADYLAMNFSIQPFSLKAGNIFGIAFGGIYFSIFFAYVAVGFVINLVVSFVNWLIS